MFAKTVIATETTDMARKIDIVDGNTGEVLEQGILGFQRPKLRHPYGKSWCYMNLQAVKTLKGVKSVTDFRVLMSILEGLGFENDIVMQQKEIADDLNMRPAHVSTSIKNLVDLGVLHRSDRRGFYTVDENFVWRGPLQRFPKKLSRETRKAQLEEQSA